MKTKLTPSFIETLNLKSEKQYYGDTEVPGLVLVIPGIPKKKKIDRLKKSTQNIINHLALILYFH